MNKDTKDPPLSRTLASTETLKLVELHTVDAFYTPLEERFERITRLGRAALGVPVAAVTLVTPQCQWFKSVSGWKVDELPIEQSLYNITVRKGDVVIVPDTLTHSDLVAHPFVKGSPRFRFYAGCPLKDQYDAIVGTFCVMDLKPKKLGPDHIQCLRDLGVMAQRELLTTELRDAQAELVSKLGVARRQAMIDPLTRVWNRRGGVALLGTALKEAEERGCSVAVCIVDIDRFKRTNDLYGHQIGDEVLCKIAQTMIGCVRSQDTVCRLGGDEFLLVLSECAEAEVISLANRIRTRVSEASIRTLNGAVPVTISIGGVIHSPGTEETAETVLKRADEALYRSKGRGRNYVEILRKTGS